MNQKELRDLIEFIVEKDIAEFEYERGDVKVRVKRGAAAAPQFAQLAAPLTVAPVTTAAPVFGPAVQPAAAAGAATTIASGARAAETEEGLHMVTSPIVGTFYESPSPGSPPFVKPGEEVNAGQVLCIIEAMKLMNEIESDVAGEIVKRLVNNGEPVEYGQRLFAVRPRA
jgi:acetyl-CoA carboxylase biotin carboxyl carrier protein